jgi:hypothetical protein
MNEGEKHAEGIKKEIEDIIGVDTVLKQKKKTDDDFQRERFEKIIQTMQEIEIREILLATDLRLDFTTYDEKFYKVIDSLIEMQFGKEAAELIFFYLYERENPDGTVNDLIDDEGTIVPLNSPNDLWQLVKISQAKVGRQKKK